MNLKLLNENVVSRYICNEMEKDETDRHYLTKQQIEQLANTKLKHKTDELIRDLFLFSCFTGLAYIDLKELRWNEIQQFSDGSWWIITRREKTNNASHVKLLDVPFRIMEKYKGLAKDNFVFPVPKYQTYCFALRRVIKQAGLELKISSHSARHSFATLLLTEGVPIESVSKMLGHTNIKTTQIYARITNEKVSRDMDLVSEKLKELENSISLTV